MVAGANGDIGAASSNNNMSNGALVNGTTNGIKTALNECTSGLTTNGAKQRGSSLKAETIVKNGSVRHILAIMALSAIVMANMNRQAYNQALVRMIKKPLKQPTVAATTSAPPANGTLNSSQMLSESGVTNDKSIGSILDDDEFQPILQTDTVTTTTPFMSNQTTSETDVNKSPVPTSFDSDEDGFEWGGSEISMLQAGFSYGYMFFMIPGGRLSEIYGSKWVIFISGFGSALCSMLTPFIASQSYYLLVGSRILMGLCQTGVSPALYAFCTRWLAPEEASVYLPMIKVGVMIGFMLGSLINALMPWRTVFYVVGAVGLLWSITWAAYASSEPSEHKFIGKAELIYIEHRLEERRKQQARKSAADIRKPAAGEKAPPAAAPWLSILTNPVVLAFTFTKFTVKLSTDTQTMQLPMYLRNVFQVSDSLNGILNGTNFAIQACLTGMVAYVAKEMVVRQTFGLSKTGVRILFQGINNFGMALSYLLISFNMGSLELVCFAVIILSISSMFGSGGEAVLPVDLTTEYAASIMAIANSLANASGILMPQVVALFLADQLTSPTRWNRVWWFVSGLMICGGTVFGLFVKAELQSFRRRGGGGTQAGKSEKQERSNGMTMIDIVEYDGRNSWTSRL